MAPITYLLLIRHGENDWVGTHRLAGRTQGVNLNDRGREQTAKLVELLKEQPISTIYSSPLERCVQTAEPIAKAFGLEVVQETGVIEVDYGEWQGGNLNELSQLPEWLAVQHYPSTFRFPGGETLHETQSRAVRAIDRIVQAHPNEVVAIFSHGDVIRTTLAHYMGIPLDLFQRILIHTASISVIAFQNGRPMIICTNHTAELPKFEIKQDEPPSTKPEDVGQESNSK